MLGGELLYSPWQPDEGSQVDKISQLIKVVESFFPVALDWDAGHRYDRGLEDDFKYEIPDVTDKSTYTDLPSLWEQTLEHLAKLGLDPYHASIEIFPYSNKFKTNVVVHVYPQFFNIDHDGQAKIMANDSEYLTDLQKKLGACDLIPTVWRMYHSAFAGDPLHLYEPKPLFTDLYDALKGETVVEEVKRVRQEAAKVITREEIVRMLEAEGFKVEHIAKDRIFVKFHEVPFDDYGKVWLSKLKDLPGAKMLKKIEDEITSRL